MCWGSIEGNFQKNLTDIRIAIAGDLHGSWSQDDLDLLLELNPDGVLFVGDLSDGDLRIVRAINKISIPTSVILGNHDRGRGGSGDVLRAQLDLLGEKNCSWNLSKWALNELSVVGARPCSGGGGFFLTPEVKSVFGEVSLDESVFRIVSAAKSAPLDCPLLILAHSGPVGLGSESSSLCGRDWKLPSMDWGDKDLGIAIDQIRKFRVPELVVFGHTHHQLRIGGNRIRKTFAQDLWGTSYLNAACVPRRGIDSAGENLCHFSWVEFSKGKLVHASHRWFRNDASIAYKESLLNTKN